MSHSTYPKLLFVGDPGALVSPAFAVSFAKNLKNCRVIYLGPGAYYLQEDHSEAIGARTSALVNRLRNADRARAAILPL